MHPLIRGVCALALVPVSLRVCRAADDILLADFKKPPVPAGLYDMPMFVGPLSSRQLDLRVEGGSMTLNRLRVHELEPIWTPDNP